MRTYNNDAKIRRYVNRKIKESEYHPLAIKISRLPQAKPKKKAKKRSLYAVHNPPTRNFQNETISFLRSAIKSHYVSHL